MENFLTNPKTNIFIKSKISGEFLLDQWARNIIGNLLHKPTQSCLSVCGLICHLYMTRQPGRITK